MKYNCSVCIYETNDRSSWYNHNISKKHIKLIENAKNKHSDQQNLNLINKDHEVELLKERLRAMENEKKAAENERNIYKLQLEEVKKQHEKELENTITLYEKRVEHVSKQVRILENQTQFQEQLINSAGGIIKK